MIGWIYILRIKMQRSSLLWIRKETWHSTFYVLLSTFYILVPNIRQSCRHCILPDSRQRLVWSDASWSPNSTDLYFWYLFVMTLLCQQTNTKDIAGQSAGLMLFVLQIVPDQFHPLHLSFSSWINGSTGNSSWSVSSIHSACCATNSEAGTDTNINTDNNTNTN